MHPILSVFKCIVRHAHRIDDSIFSTSLIKLKRKIRKPPVSATNSRSRIIQIFALEKDLRDVCENRSSMLRIKSIWGLTHLEVERNQGGTYLLNQAHDQRRFDEYNSEPRSAETASSRHRRAQFSNTYANFVNKWMQHSFPESNTPRKVVVSTIFAPFYRLQRTRAKTRRPRPVELKSFTRNSGKLTILRVRGVPSRLSGFKRHVSTVDTDYTLVLNTLEHQIWLANQYAQDPLDGEDMSDWVQHLVEEKNRIKNKMKEHTLKMEVHRRILFNRRARLASEWEWKWKRQAQNLERQEKLYPRRLLTLDML